MAKTFSSTRLASTSCWIKVRQFKKLTHGLSIGIFHSQILKYFNIINLIRVILDYFFQYPISQITDKIFFIIICLSVIKLMKLFYGNSMKSKVIWMLIPNEYGNNPNILGINCNGAYDLSATSLHFRGLFSSLTWGAKSFLRNFRDFWDSISS